MRTGYQKILRIVFFCNLFTITSLCYALPFNIFPKAGTVLPIQVFPGDTATAFYTVQNNTTQFLVNNFVKYLPPNVSQDPTDSTYTDTCATTFNLNPQGSPGDSCTLVLKIQGPVNATDPDPHHHLFVCAACGTPCAGPFNQLNVASFRQFAYVANNTSGLFRNTITICHVSGSDFVNCSINVDVTYFHRPEDVVLNNDASFAYVLNTQNDTISSLKVNSDGTLTGIAETPNGFFPNVDNGGLDPKGQKIYLTLQSSNIIKKCPILNSGPNAGAIDYMNCSNITNSNFNKPTGRVNFNRAGTRVYFANNGNNTVCICDVNSNGDFTSCSTFGGPGPNPFFQPLGSSIDPFEKFLYVANDIESGQNTVTSCKIFPNGLLGNCTKMNDPSFNWSDHRQINLFISNNHLGYIPNRDNNTVSICPIINGLFGTCSATSGTPFVGFFVTPTSVWISLGDL